MSKDIIVLAPNGRRQTIHCTADTSILQILEMACQKQGFQPGDYDLKHHNHLLDLTTTIRFANLPNKATVEMVEADRKRVESNVTIGLLLEDGERRTADFAPSTSLFDLITSLAPSELNSLMNPTILYMRQEVIGVLALREKTLRHLGLIKGRAILRLLNKAEEAIQANVSAVYRRPFSEPPPKAAQETVGYSEAPGPSSKGFNPIALIKHEKAQTKPEEQEPTPMDFEETKPTSVFKEPKPPQSEKHCYFNLKSSSSSNTSMTEEQLERRLNIEKEVMFLGTQKAIAYMQPEEVQDELEDLPDEFYELSIEEIRKLYRDMQQQRISLENAPLITSSKKQELDSQSSSIQLSVYKNVVVRIKFPDGIILQGVFQPTNTIEDVHNFVKEHLSTPHKQFHIFTTPLQGNLNVKMTLLEAKFVPCVLMHFKWNEEGGEQRYLKEEIYTKKTTSDAASILASKYRAPSRRKLDKVADKKQIASTSGSKVPKWFK